MLHTVHPAGHAGSHQPEVVHRDPHPVGFRTRWIVVLHKETAEVDSLVEGNLVLVVHIRDAAGRIAGLVVGSPGRLGVESCTDCRDPTSLGARKQKAGEREPNEMTDGGMFEEGEDGEMCVGDNERRRQLMKEPTPLPAHPHHAPE